MQLFLCVVFVSAFVSLTKMCRFFFFEILCTSFLGEREKKKQIRCTLSSSRYVVNSFIWFIHWNIFHYGIFWLPFISRHIFAHDERVFSYFLTWCCFIFVFFFFCADSVRLANLSMEFHWKRLFHFSLIIFGILCGRFFATANYYVIVYNIIVVLIVATHELSNGSRFCTISKTAISARRRTPCVCRRFSD